MNSQDDMTPRYNRKKQVWMLSGLTCMILIGLMAESLSSKKEVSLLSSIAITEEPVVVDTVPIATLPDAEEHSRDLAKIQDLEATMMTLNNQHTQELATVKQEQTLFKQEMQKEIDQNFATIRKLESELLMGQKLLKAKEEELARINSSRVFEDQLSAKNRSLANALELEKSKQLSLQADWEKKFSEERQVRLSKEDLLEKMSFHLEEQKAALVKMEQARISLTQELEATKQNYVQLIDQLKDDKKEQVNPLNSQFKKHLVAKGETLSSISLKYYGTSQRWKEIYEVNKGLIPNTNNIRVGAEIVIP